MRSARRQMGAPLVYARTPWQACTGSGDAPARALATAPSAVPGARDASGYTPLPSSLRSHTCDALRVEAAESCVTLCGWLQV
ncbi:hypothetical protein EON67_08795 [archaeon]|nr:MAG: hypothetical protein EON67_08795 [archaeon]